MELLPLARRFRRDNSRTKRWRSRRTGTLKRQWESGRSNASSTTKLTMQRWLPTTSLGCRRYRKQQHPECLVEMPLTLLGARGGLFEVEFSSVVINSFLTGSHFPSDSLRLSRSDPTLSIPLSPPPPPPDSLSLPEVDEGVEGTASSTPALNRSSP